VLTDDMLIQRLLDFGRFLDLIPRTMLGTGWLLLRWLGGQGGLNRRLIGAVEQFLI
jgi:hypothetical protein